MSLTSYRAAPPRGGWCDGVWGCVGRPGGALLSRALRRSTMGAGGFHVRVRDGIGCSLPAKATRSSNTALARRFGASARGVRFWFMCMRLVEFGLRQLLPTLGHVWMIAVHGLMPGSFGLMGILGNFEPIGRLGPVS